MSSGPDLFRPSEFWLQLAGEHQDQLDRFGTPLFKRSQALRYFTWRWRPRQSLRSEQLRFLLRHTGPADWLRAVRPPIVIAGDAWRPIDWSAGERLFYTVATRLARRYASRHGDQDVLALEEPPQGTPLPVYADGRLISQDLANTALEIHSLREAAGGRAPRSILEIGGGYGRTAHALLSLYPQARYTIVDIEPAISISRWYLAQLFDTDRLTFLSPADIETIPDGTFDLALSISSLQEMRRDQVVAYLALMDRSVSGTVYLKQWTEWSNSADGITQRFRDYPIPRTWRPLFSRPAAIQTTFTEAAWRLDPAA